VGQLASLGICLANNQHTPQPSTIPRQAQTTDMSVLSHSETRGVTSQPNEMPPSVPASIIRPRLLPGPTRARKSAATTTMKASSTARDERDALAAHEATRLLSLIERQSQSRHCLTRANSESPVCYPPLVTLPRNCTVSIRDTEGVLHTVQVQGSSLFEAAAHAVAAFREESWAAEALGPAAVLRVEVHAPSVVHEVPLKAVERWLRSPSPSPKEMTTKIAAGSKRVREEP
jgi:hypothetical protein